ncbi:hypothetical protein HWV62_10164 [Athelia sp. TMB]|nr:hypothetical protein HWV62_10164 [Athelia sp. TMB]
MQHGSDYVRFQLLEHHILQNTKEIGEAKADIQALFKGSSTEVSLELGKADSADVLQRLPTTISFTLSTISDDADVLRLHEAEAILQARGSLSQMSAAPSALGKVQTVSSMSIETLNSAKSFEDIWGSVLRKLELFTQIVDRVSVVIIAQQNSDDAVYHLMETIDEVHAFLSEAQPTETIRTHREILEDLSALTVECAYLIRDYTADRDFWMRIAHLTLAGVESRIRQYDEKFKELKTRFNERAIVRIDIMLLRCLEQFQDIQSRTITLIINDLPYADGAGFDPAKACIPGTRVFVLDELHRWINERDGDGVPRLLVLTGVPGFGKSAVANSLAQHYRKVKRLGSFVSFSRADQTRRHPGNLLSTISRDIADLDPHWRLALCGIVENDHSLAKGMSPTRQMESLILEPAKSLTIAGPVVIIIDALDESGSAYTRAPLLEVLSQTVSTLPRNFRVLVTARPEKDIVSAFSRKHPDIQQKRLDTMDLATIDLDIAIYIERQLAPLLDTFDREWTYRERWLGMLVTGSHHVFQWAATTCRAILEAEEYGVGYLAGLISEILEAGENLDDLYKLILRRKFPEQDTMGILHFKHGLGCILAAKAPLSKQEFMELFGEDNDGKHFESVLAPLGSLLNGVGDTSPITARHASFFDFLADEGRSAAYFIDPTQYDQYLARACLRILSSGLKFNICELPSSYTTNTTLEDLPDRVAEHIGPVLGYAGRFLGRHLGYTPYDQIVLKGLQALLKQKFLYWLEVLSLLKLMGEASKLFNSVHEWVQAQDIDFSAFTRDAIRFLETFMPPIAQSVPHIYLSALPFAPTQSLIFQTYSPQYPSTARLKAGKLDQWPAMIKTFEGHTHEVSAVAYSPNGRRIASASLDGTIRVRDTETGEELWAPFQRHSKAVLSIAYSPSGRHIVSGSFDDTVQIWDSETGEAVGESPFKHYAGVNCVTYSSDGMHILSCAINGLVRIWNVQTGKAGTPPIEGKGDYLSTPTWCVAYSPDGLHIVVGYDNTGKINVYDTETGGAVGPSLKGHSGRVNCIVYSPDGTRIASCSLDNTIRLWDAKTRQAVGVLKGHAGPVLSVAYSLDGARLVSGSQDKAIRVWDVATRNLIGEPLKGHGGGVRSVAYSPDGAHIVSGSSDFTVRVWGADAVEFQTAGTTWQESSNTFLSIAYSPNGASIVSRSLEGYIQMWDSNTGQPGHLPINILGPHKDLTAFACSPDGAHIVLGSFKKRGYHLNATLQIWNLLTGQAVTAPLEGHFKKITSIAYSADGSQIISGSWDRYVRIWNAQSGQNLRRLGEPGSGPRSIWSVAYSPDGRHVVSGCDERKLSVWNTETSVPPSALYGHKGTVLCIAYSPDGTRIVSGSSDNTLRLWDAEREDAIGMPLIGHHENVECVAFSPDGRRIVSGSGDQTMRIWDAKTYELVGVPIQVHSGFVNSVTYSPDGTRIASASSDNTIRVWDVTKIETSPDSGAPAEFRHDCKLDNGWIMTASSQLLLWIPPWNRQGLVWPSNVSVVAPSLIDVDLTDFVHGSDWESCKVGANDVERNVEC